MRTTLLAISEEVMGVLQHKPHTEAGRRDPLATARGFLSGLRQKYQQQFRFTSADRVRYYKASAK